MILSTQVALLQKSIPFRFPSPTPAVCLQKTHILAIILLCAKVSQPDLYILFSNLAPFFPPDLKRLPDPLCTVATPRSILKYRSK
jgi:hypothetical protein